MNRRTFLDCAGRITTCCGAALALSQVESAAAATPDAASAGSSAVPKPSGRPVTPDRQRVEWAKVWVSRLMKNCARWSRTVHRTCRRRFVCVRWATCARCSRGRWGARCRSNWSGPFTAATGNAGSPFVFERRCGLLWNPESNDEGSRISDKILPAARSGSGPTQRARRHSQRTQRDFLCENLCDLCVQSRRSSGCGSVARDSLAVFLLPGAG